MRLHGGNKPRIMRRLPANLIACDQGLPGRVDARIVRQQGEHALQSREFDGGRGGRHSEPILLNRPCCHHPKFHKILGNDVESPAAARQ